MPAETVENERRIAETAAKEEGKPEQAIPKIVEGRVNAFFKDNVLLEQASVVENKKTVADVLAENGTTVRAFARFEPGQAREPPSAAGGRKSVGIDRRDPVHGSPAPFSLPLTGPSRRGRRRLRVAGVGFSETQGEAFSGGGGLGVDPDVVASIARQIADVVRGGTEVAVVIGGGNYFRGAKLSERGMERARADYMGMLGTVMNCLALQDFCEKAGVETRVQTAIAMGRAGR